MNLKTELKDLNPYEFYSDDGGTNWWFICPECKKITRVIGRYCEHCNAQFPWVKQPWEAGYSKKQEKEDGSVNE